MLSLKNLSLNLGNTVLLDRANITIEKGERLCLVGRNGAGKSTLMKVLAGEQQADSGEVLKSPGLSIAELPQNVPADIDGAGSVFDVVADGLGATGRAVAEYHRLLHEAPDDLDALGRAQAVLEAGDGWTIDARIGELLTRLSLPEDTRFDSLSGGLKRRVLLARALVAGPELLLLDEPTNHLDIASITWIEEFLSTWPGTLLFITHDRTFLRRLATRIVELDRGILKSWPGTYDDYLRRKEEALRAEAQTNALFDKKLAQEEVWIRKGIQARRTRDQGRVERLKQMRREFAERRELQGAVKLSAQEADKSGKLVAEARDVSFARGERTLIRKLTTTVLRGDKIGIVGPNGAGKTTLLKLLLGQLEPDAGTLKLGTNLQVAYFDQLRAKLDDEAPVYQNIGDGKEFVTIDGKQLHVMSYLQNFLFTPDRARSPAKALSGGERARLLLAQLFAKPSNLLVLDEPTNDLDIETLDLLEELIVDYAGTVLIVSHDRAFLDNVVTRCVVFGEGGRIDEAVGGYSDWLRQSEAGRVAQGTTPTSPRADGKPDAAPTAQARPATGASLGSKELRELDALPAKIEKLETEQATLIAALADPALYAPGADPKARDKLQARLAATDAELATVFARWESLEARR